MIVCPPFSQYSSLFQNIDDKTLIIKLALYRDQSDSLLSWIKLGTTRADLQMSRENWSKMDEKTGECCEVLCCAVKSLVRS